MSDKAVEVIAKYMRWGDRLAAEQVLAALKSTQIDLVELPEADEVDEDGQMWFGNYDIRVDTTGAGTEHPRLYVDGQAMNPALIRNRAVALLAALHEVDKLP